MNNEIELKWGVKFEKMFSTMRSVGMCVSSDGHGEIYLYIALYKWNVAIGRLSVFDED